MAINKNKVMEAAQKLVEKGQVDKAIKEYLKVVQEDPKDVRVWLKIGDLYAKKGAKAEATETYLKVAQFYGEQGFYLKAVAVYKQILKLDSRLIDVNLKLAEVYRQLGLLSDAMQQYELVAAHYHREGKTREALSTIKDMVELDPENVATRIKLAELYSKEGLASEAIAEFQRASEFLRQHNRMDDFIKVAERLVWHQPENHAINRELAELYLKRNDPRRALQKLQACFKADPRDVATLGMLAQAFLALDQKPKTVSVWKELARIHEENGQKGSANEVYRKILQIQPDDADAMAAVGGGTGTGARRVPAGTGGTPAISTHGPPPPAPPLPEHSSRMSASVAAPSPRAPATPAPAFARTTPVTGGPSPNVRRPTGSVPILGFEDNSPQLQTKPENQRPQQNPRSAPPASQATGGRFDLDDDVPISTSTGDTTSRRNADEVELEMDDFTGGSDVEQEVVLGAGADPAEAHADEIAKILTETDVYVKYGLHQKAVEHLKRVFDLDPRNLEARERLKDVFISLNRHTEAATELVRLAEQTAGSNPPQASQYLAELFALAPGDPRGEALAKRHRLNVASAPADEEPELEFTNEADLEFEGGEDLVVENADDVAAELEAELQVSADDLDSGLAVAAEAESELGVDFDELGFDSVGSAATGVGDEDLPGVAVAAGDPSAMSMDFELDDFGGAAEPAPAPRAESTQVVADDQVELAEQEPEYDVEDSARGGGFDDGANRFASPAPMPARAPKLDSGPAQAGKWDSRLPPAPAPAPPSPFDSDDDFGLDAALGVGDDSTDGQPTTEGQAAGPSGSGSGIEDELDEADFFVGQGLWDEAKEILHNLLSRYPNHPLVSAKLADVRAAEGADGDGSTAADLAVPSAQGSPMPAPVPTAPAAAPAAKRPAVISQHRLGDSDADTHYDLGLAYKEMGLHDEAIKEFMLVRETPGRAVQCHLMIGLCHLERGKLTEAVGEFKSGLYVEGINEREAMALYYELGAAYDTLGDAREALYYFEKVTKRDAKYRDVASRIEALKKKAKASGGRGGSVADPVTR